MTKTPTPVAAGERCLRQKRVHEWCVAAFGQEHASSIPQRAIRLLEESIEAYQSVGADKEMAHKLIDYVFERNAGNLSQELGGIGITVLALAEAAGLSADDEEQRELERVLAKPLAHFAERNEYKNQAGFVAQPAAPPAPQQYTYHTADCDYWYKNVCSCGGVHGEPQYPAPVLEADGETLNYRGFRWRRVMPESVPPAPDGVEELATQLRIAFQREVVRMVETPEFKFEYRAIEVDWEQAATSILERVAREVREAKIAAYERCRDESAKNLYNCCDEPSAETLRERFDEWADAERKAGT